MCGVVRQNSVRSRYSVIPRCMPRSRVPEFGCETPLICSLVLALFLFSVWPAETEAYSVLSHEAIIDSVWDINIRPLLLKRFPHATSEDIKEAHSYAYGGAIIHDLGYYRHGSHFFSNLTHYARSGDFILALLRNANDLDSYAFALGSLTTPLTTTAKEAIRVSSIGVHRKAYVRVLFLEPI
jgi:Zinc dependent phospholipase C